MIIKSHEVNYNYENKVIKYLSGGNVVTKNDTINSEKFTHNLNTNISQFNKDVSLINQEYDITSQQINYKNNTITFSGSTTIKHEDFTINCTNGFLETEKTLKLSNGVIVYFNNQSIKANNFKRDIIKKENYFQNNIHVIVDTNTHIFW